MNRVSVTLLLALAAAPSGCAKKSETADSAKQSAAPISTWEPKRLRNTGAIKILGLGGPTDKPWDAMNYEEKEWYMVGKVHPVMRQVFQTFNERKYEGEKFECTPCHGENPEERKYAMPSDHLSPVPEFGSPAWKKMENSRVFKFMNKRVTPSMGSLLGKEIWKTKTGEGYGCWGCHPKAE